MERFVAGLSAVSTKAPSILCLFVTENVAVAAIHNDTKECRAGRIPAVFRLHDLEGFLSKVQPHRTLIALVSGVARHPYNLLTHEFALLPGAPRAPRSRPLRGK